MKGRWERTKEFRKSLSQTMKLRPNSGWFKTGHRWTPEIEKKRVRSLTGKKVSDETKRKIGEANKKWEHPSGFKNPNWKGGKIKKECLVCGKKFEVFIYRKDAKYCSVKCANKGKIGAMVGRKHWHWKGGKQPLASGHIQIWMPNHPFSDSRGRIFEHRLVMEKHLGRYLKKGEVVHHIDGNPSNNSLNNLMLFPNNGAHLKYQRKSENK